MDSCRSALTSRRNYKKIVVTEDSMIARVAHKYFA
jgi:hypothetical protein